jgi:hypothetical protein
VVAEGHQVHLGGAGCADYDVLLVQPQVRRAPLGIVGEDEEAHTADAGSERVERAAVVLGLERPEPTNVERDCWHRRLLDLPHQLGLFLHDRRAKGEVSPNLCGGLWEEVEPLPAPADVGVVGRLERVSACLLEQGPAARKY